MDGSGLEDLWSTTYASLSAKKMLSGHAFSRSLRAHILTFTALGIVICKNIETTELNEDFIKTFFEKWDSEPPLIGDCNTEPDMHYLTEQIINKINTLEKRSATAKLWIQYFKAVIVALEFIEAERLGNWELHLKSIKNMLPLFHAAGHFAYAKSAQM